jgi:hypothetical protein
MGGLRWWMRIVGVFYLVQATIAAIVRLPIRVLAPAGTLEAAGGTDPVARLLVDTWILFGLEIAVVGGALLFASRSPERARPLAWLVLALELFRGIAHDLHMIGRGYDPPPFIIWVVIHLVIIATGYVALRRTHLVPA